MVSEEETEIRSFLWEELDSGPWSTGGVGRGDKGLLLTWGLHRSLPGRLWTKSFVSLPLHFLICKMGDSPLWGCHED